MHFWIEVQTDVKLLLECLKCQVNNQSAVKQALLTLSSIFSTYGRYMYWLGCISFLIYKLYTCIAFLRVFEPHL